MNFSGLPRPRATPRLDECQRLAEDRVGEQKTHAFPRSPLNKVRGCNMSGVGVCCDGLDDACIQNDVSHALRLLPFAGGLRLGRSVR